MHVLVSWDIHEDGEQWNELNSELKACIKRFSWVKPLSTFYIVKIREEDDRNEIKDRLTKVCRDHPKKIHYIISPINDGGATYGGWLPGDMWEKIRARTETEDRYE